ncbi:hypothetical protein [Caldalkalibacillus salinus]|uniref:hypothetical protein n=1 Tax=Caldalkalibacillus salinus TaxID=2803787 RepID=UPI0019210013|nr:hypothetical protein [Caldalkalibacillus salinus]
MRLAIKEWLLLGIGVLVISTLVFNTMYDTVTDKANEMDSTINSTNLPEQGSEG